MPNAPKTPPEQLAALDRRELLRLLTLGGIVSAAALTSCAENTTPPAAAPSAPPLPPAPRPTARPDFLFLQLSDTHFGYEGPNNPEAAHTLKDAVAAINASPLEPDFVVFTGDLTHTTDDGSERRRRMREFSRIVADLKVKTRYFLPGEHDAMPDQGAAFREAFGETHGSFEHGGIHFVRLDNVSAGPSVGEAQLDWLAHDLAPLPAEMPVVVLAHRPLFDLFPSWDWATADGARVVELLTRFSDATVFYGHIHQEHHRTTANVRHHAARSLVFPLPAPGSVPKKAPLVWQPESTDHGLGYRSVRETGGEPAISDLVFNPVPARAT
ncbi:MAG TPA: metallophosphoesterase [Polyangiaceae bacterium]|nr:metallophosphoesterase [Polyangiaceae bacterium]